MKDLKEAIVGAKNAVYRVRWEIERCGIDAPLGLPDWEEVVDALVFLKGFVTCIEMDFSASKCRICPRGGV